MKLYYFPVSTYCQKVLLGLYERGLDFVPSVVVAKNIPQVPGPLKQVPLLELDGELLAESSIILERLDGLPAPGPRLFPQDDTALDARYWDRVCDLHLDDPAKILFFDSRKPAAERNPADAARARAMLDVVYGMLEARLADRPFLAGPRFTVADCSAAPALALAGRVHAFTSHARLRAYFIRLAERPSFARVQAEAAPFAARTEAA